MPTPQAILFDLFHTLIDLRSGASGPSTPEFLGIDPIVWSKKVVEESPHHALGEVTDGYESLRLIVHAIDPVIPEEQIREAARLRPARFRAALLNVRPAILASLTRLRARGLRLGLISNAGIDEVSAWLESPLAPLFDVALFSCHEALMKPNPQIYLRAAEKLGVPPGECLFVGDGGSREHEGARAAGMASVLLLGLLRESYPDIADQRPRIADWTLETFEELEALVLGLEHGSA